MNGNKFKKLETKIVEVKHKGDVIDENEHKPKGEGWQFLRAKADSNGNIALIYQRFI